MQLTKTRADNLSLIDRREKVIVLLTKGLKGYQIAKELKVNSSTISRDIRYLSKESSTDLNSVIKNTMPFLYQISLEGIKNILQECWNIYQSKSTSVSYFHKLNALKLAKECNESLFKLVAEGPCVVYLRELEERLERIENHKKEST